jgi:hypothetical protein
MAKATKTPKTLDEAYEQVLAELLIMFLKKHRDYGKGNILSIKELGISMRLAEKVERLKNLLMKQEMGEAPVNESVEDTWIDIAVYAVIGVLVRRNHFQSLDVSKKALEKV